MTSLRRADLTPGCDYKSHQSADRPTHAAAQRCSRSPRVWLPVRIGRLARFDAGAPGGRLVQRRRDLPRHQRGFVGSSTGHTLTAAPSNITASEQAHAPCLSALTRAEHTVARLVADGWSNREIADRLTVSHRTIESHMRAIYRKLAVTSRVQIAAVVFGTHR